MRESDGEPFEVLVATWGRDHGLGWFVARAEDVYYRVLDRAPVGGTPTLSTDLSAEGGFTASPVPAGTSTTVTGRGAGTPSATASPTTAPPSATATTVPVAAGSPTPRPAPGRQHLDPPARLVSPVSDPLPKEGVWQPVGFPVDGMPALYMTRVRADDVHTSVLASLLWVDTSLTRALFVPGYQEPGGPNPYDGALPEKYWPDVLANWNGAFRLQDSGGGYYYGGTTVAPLRDGVATAVFYDDGRLDIGEWGRDLRMTPHVEVVRQNLQLIVDKGRSQVTNASDSWQWGATTDGESLAWRSAVGVRADGSLVYIGSPYLSAGGLADTLVSAGVQRAMTLDMNNWWTAGFYFSHDESGAPVCHKVDPSILEGCDRFLLRYKRDSFQILARHE
ncbi:MAG: phosphodiester glycosidase family protein [Candidatus Nanopelagicales bacterium]